MTEMDKKWSYEVRIDGKGLVLGYMMGIGQFQEDVKGFSAFLDFKGRKMTFFVIFIPRKRAKSVEND